MISRALLSSALIGCQLLLVSCATTNSAVEKRYLDEPGGTVLHLPVEGAVEELCRDVLGYDYPQPEIKYWEEGGVTAWDITTRGKHGLITSRFVVEDGKVIGYEVLSSKEQRGKQIESRRYLRQFAGLSLVKGGRLSGRVDGISGATMSSRAVESAALLALRLDDISDD